jgi:hypothetical protein
VDKEAEVVLDLRDRRVGQDLPDQVQALRDRQDQGVKPDGLAQQDQAVRGRKDPQDLVVKPDGQDRLDQVLQEIRARQDLQEVVKPVRQAKPVRRVTQVLHYLICK